MSVVAELDAALQALRALKPPGVTKSRVANIVTLCAENVKSESVLVQKIFTNFKKTPATHKLGVLYVVDAVTRRWIELAHEAKQSIAQGAASDGTFAAGVTRVTELLPHMMNDLNLHAPDDQKDKIMKLIEIWERGEVFPAHILSNAKKAIIVRPPQPIQATPASQSQTLTTSPKTEVPVKAALAQQFNHTANGADAKAQAGKTNGMANDSGSDPSTQPQAALELTAQENLEALASILPPGATSDPQLLSQYLQLLQHLLDMQVPPEQWPDVIAALNDQVQAAKDSPSNDQDIDMIDVAEAASANKQALGDLRNPLMSMKTSSKKHASAKRRRSRSPPRIRGSPDYGPQGRERSPQRTATPSTQADKIPLSDTPKWTGHDRSLPDGHIKVLSRTLFVSGVSCDADGLRSIFGHFGDVQSCTFDAKKRQAFLKIYTRAGAEKARESMSDPENDHFINFVKLTRWGSGFGPRDCSSHETGESVIPIARLSEADHKCALHAEYGGTGGRPLSTGLVLEEPDLDYNPPPKGARRALDSRRGALPRNVLRRHNRDRDQTSNGSTPVLPYVDPPEHYDTNNVGTPPTVPSFGFQLSTLG
ncbi:MAG: hypothetical protein M1828_002396 [Chrysothrix sp. TS-e1954]|nr:MAG: hypothetical protein M1828_002396 [Chrysothrix sp. TS-e1954]